MSFWERWFRGKQFTGQGRTLHDAIEDATEHQRPGWYRIVEINVQKTNPISDYRVTVTPTDGP